MLECDVGQLRPQSSCIPHQHSYGPLPLDTPFALYIITPVLLLAQRARRAQSSRHDTTSSKASQTQKTSIKFASTAIRFESRLKQRNFSHLTAQGLVHLHLGPPSVERNRSQMHQYHSLHATILRHPKPPLQKTIFVIRGPNSREISNKSFRARRKGEFLYFKSHQLLRVSFQSLKLSINNSRDEVTYLKASLRGRAEVSPAAAIKIRLSSKIYSTKRL